MAHKSCPTVRAESQSSHQTNPGSILLDRAGEIGIAIHHSIPRCRSNGTSNYTCHKQLSLRQHTFLTTPQHTNVHLQQQRKQPHLSEPRPCDAAKNENRQSTSVTPTFFVSSRSSLVAQAPAIAPAPGLSSLLSLRCTACCAREREWGVKTDYHSTRIQTKQEHNTAAYTLSTTIASKQTTGDRRQYT